MPNPPLSSLSEALPACQDCQTPISRVENRWHRDEDGRWRLRATMVCPAGHRVLVEPF